MCGRFIDNTVLHDRFSDKSYQAEIKEQEVLRLDKLILNINENDNRAFRSLKAFYDSCKNHEALNELKASRLLSAFKNLGGWPLLENDWSANGETWLTLNRKIFQTGFTKHYLIKVELEGDPRDSSKYILQLKPPGFEDHNLYSYYYQFDEGLNNTNVKHYYKYMVDHSIQFGADRKKAEAEMLDVLQFEMDLQVVRKDSTI